MSPFLHVRWKVPVADTSRHTVPVRYSSIRQCIRCGFPPFIIVSVSLKVFFKFFLLIMTYCRNIYISLHWYKISVSTSVGDSDLDPQDPIVFGGTDPALGPDPSLFS